MHVFLAIPLFPKTLGLSLMQRCRCFGWSLLDVVVSCTSRYISRLNYKVFTGRTQTFMCPLTHEINDTRIHFSPFMNLIFGNLLQKEKADMQLIITNRHLWRRILLTTAYIYTRLPFLKNLVDANWSEWSKFSPCTLSCGGGTHTRTRTCTNPPPKFDGQDCVGESEDVQQCNTLPCPGQ